MTSFLKWLLLPVRAPMLTLLGAISFYLGAHWGFQQDSIRSAMVVDSYWDEIFWAFALLQVFVLVFFCTLPDLVLRQISLFMAASKVITLVITLLVVVLAGMYLLYMPGFVDLLVLAAALMLARLDMVRLNIWPPSWVALLGFTSFIMFFVVYGHTLHLRLFSMPLFHGLLKLGLTRP
ncbi:MAG: hypothetical protein ACOYLI_12320 [Synechococcus lacustris]|jgi:hypothetical protein